MDKVRLQEISAGSMARAAIVVVAIWALANLVWMVREVLFIAFFAVLVAVFLSFFAEFLIRLGVPRALAVVLVAIGVIAILSGLWFLIWPTLQDQVRTLQQQLPSAIERITAWAEDRYRGISGHVGLSAEEVERELHGRLGSEASRVVEGAVPLLNSILGAVAGFLIVLVAGLYIAVNPEVYRTGAERLLPPRLRGRVTDTLEEVAHTLRWWMAGTLVNMVVVGSLVGIGLWVAGVPAALALAVIAGLFEFIPIVGPWLAAIPAAALALMISPATLIWVAVIYIVVQQLESNITTPLIMKQTIELPPALTVLFQTLMAVMFGFLGLLLAVPILAAVIVLVRGLYVEPIEERDAAA